MRTVRCLIGFVALLAASSALAGTSTQYPVIVTGGSYAPLGDAGSPVPGVTGTYAGAAAIALNGWTFPYFDAGFSEITVTTDGYLIVGDGLLGGCTPDAGSGYCSSLTCPTSFGQYCCGDVPACALENTYSPCCVVSGNYAPYQLGPAPSARGSIAAWWEALDDTATSGISYAQGGASGSHYLTVDYHGVQSADITYGSGNTYDFSITLSESGLVQVAYGATSVVPGATADFQIAWVSLEDPAGTTWVPGLGCELDGGYSSYRSPSCAAVFGDWPTNSDLTYGAPPGVYLEPETITATNGSVDGGTLSFSVAALAGDLGQTAVTATFPYNVYLVQSLIQPQDLPACPGGAGCLGSFDLTGGIPAQSSVPLSSGTLLTPYPPASGPGTYYVELWLDPANSTGNTSNAVGLSPPLLVGIDLTGSVNVAATATPPLVPGTGTFPVPITLQNLGLLPATGVEYQLWLTASNTAINAATDFKVEDATIALNGGADVSQSDTATTLNAAQGTYYLALAIDPSGASGDINPGNNLAFSAGQVTVSPAHLKVTQVTAPAAAYVGFPTHVGYTISNDGANPATDFSIGLLIHPQARGTSFTINDPQILELDGVTIPPGCTVQAQDATVVVDSPVGCATFPAAAADGGVLQSVVPTKMYGTATAPGDYLVGVVADLYSQVNETRNANRLASATATVVFPPEPDFEVGAGDVTAPTAAAAGDRLYVDRQIHNVGIAAGRAPYGYFLSAVGQANSGGIPVPVVVLPSGATTFLPMTTNLAAPGQGISDDLGTDLLALPTTLPPGSYTLALIVDPGGQVPELDATNDTGTTVQPIAIVADGLQIVSSNLPTALVQVPYAYQLTATGALGTPSWAVLSGTLPAGLTLSAGGAISGTPTATGTTSFIVQVTVAAAGGTTQSQIAALDITVAQASGPLQVLTSGPELPPATVGRPYTMQLAAAGGVPPYRWSGTPPGGGDLVLEPSGLIAGTPTQATAGVTPFAVTVSDQAGNTSHANLRLQIVDQGTLIITTTTLAPVTVGQAFSVTIDATENDNLPHTYAWTLPPGQSLPPGVDFTQQGSPALGQLSGTASSGRHLGVPGGRSGRARPPRVAAADPRGPAPASLPAGADAAAGHGGPELHGHAPVQRQQHRHLQALLRRSPPRSDAGGERRHHGHGRPRFRRATVPVRGAGRGQPGQPGPGAAVDPRPVERRREGRLQHRRRGGVVARARLRAVAREAQARDDPPASLAGQEDACGARRPRPVGAGLPGLGLELHAVARNGGLDGHHRPERHGDPGRLQLEPAECRDRVHGDAALPVPLRRLQLQRGHGLEQRRALVRPGQLPDRPGQLRRLSLQRRRLSAAHHGDRPLVGRPDRLLQRLGRLPSGGRRRLPHGHPPVDQREHG